MFLSVSQAIAAEAETVTARIALASADKEAFAASQAAQREAALADALRVATERAEALEAEADALRHRLASSGGAEALAAHHRDQKQRQIQLHREQLDATAAAEAEAAEAERAGLSEAKAALERAWLASGVRFCCLRAGRADSAPVYPLSRTLFSLLRTTITSSSVLHRRPADCRHENVQEGETVCADRPVG